MVLKKSIKLSQRLTIWLFSHPWLKLVALIVAILVWLYVNSEISRAGIKYN